MTKIHSLLEQKQNCWLLVSRPSVLMLPANVRKNSGSKSRSWRKICFPVLKLLPNLCFVPFFWAARWKKTAFYSAAARPSGKAQSARPVLEKQEWSRKKKHLAEDRIGRQIQKQKEEKCKKQERKIYKSGIAKGDERLGRGLSSPPRQRHWQTNKNPKGNKNIRKWN